ncbi:hypothetical protein BGW80DRAFT_1349949 [Lactifluus volemus]|nr:hypothetical protein BGW80DRAFT_1349949 [Lactifluus volemus]
MLAVLFRISSTVSFLCVHSMNVVPTIFAITPPSTIDRSSDSDFLTVVLCSLLLTIVYTGYDWIWRSQRFDTRLKWASS